MSFADEKLNQFSKKKDLVRINPRRVLNSRMTLVSSNLYTTPFFAHVGLISKNGENLTEVFSTPSVNHTYQILENEILIYSTVAPSDTEIFILEFFLYFTNASGVVTYSDPKALTGPLQEWRPLLQIKAGVTVGVRDILVGSFSIGVGNIQVINADNIHLFFTDDDSYKGAPVEAWGFINKLENIELLFSGKVSSFTVNQKSINFTVDDKFSALLDPATVGDDENSLLNEINYPLINPDDVGKPIPLLLIGVSDYTVKQDVDFYLTRYQPELSAINSDYREQADPWLNRYWVAYRGLSDSLPFTIGPYTSVSVSIYGLSGGVFKSVELATADHGIIQGDIIKIVNTNGTFYKIVDLVSGVNIRFKDDSNIIHPSTLSNLTHVHHVSLLRGEDLYYLAPIRDYSTSYTLLDNGTYLMNITLVPNFNTNHGIDPLEPQTDKILFRAKTDETLLNHADVVKWLLTKAGVEVNGASFNAVKAESPITTGFTIPFFDESDYGSYLDYIESILSSAFSYLSLNNEGEVEYYLFKTPDTDLTDVNSSNILEGSFSKQISYTDLITKIVAYNPHASVHYPYSSETLENIKAKHLHKIDKLTRFRHVLTEIAGPLNYMLNFRSEARSSFEVETKHEFLDGRVGQNVSLQKEKVLGDNETVNLKILELEKSMSSTKLSLTDLKGV